MIHIIKPHREPLPTDGLAHIPDDGLDLRPGMHPGPIVIPSVAAEPEAAFAVAPGLDAEHPLRIAVVAVDFGEVFVVAGVLAAGHLPAAFRLALCARDALARAHARGGGPAGPVEGVEGARGVGVEFKVDEGGELGGGVGEEVVVRAEAGRLPHVVQV